MQVQGWQIFIFTVAALEFLFLRNKARDYEVPSPVYIYCCVCYILFIDIDISVFIRYCYLVIIMIQRNLNQAVPYSLHVWYSFWNYFTETSCLSQCKERW